MQNCSQSVFSQCFTFDKETNYCIEFFFSRRFEKKSTITVTIFFRKTLFSLRIDPLFSILVKFFISLK